MENARKRWYVVQTYSGLENSVKEDLERRIESMNMKDYIFQVIIPEEKYEELKSDGSVKEKVRKMFPGYIFVEMIVNDRSWFVVRNTPKVTGFLGSSGGGAKPVPLTTEEANLILEKIGLMAKPENLFEIGEKVRVISGPFSGQVGEVSNYSAEKKIVTVLIEIFGRRSPSDFDFSEVEKI
jgi:transcriptional antiterminator NusG